MSMLSSFVHKISSLICEIASTMKSAYTVTTRPMIERRERQKAEAQKSRKRKQSKRKLFPNKNIWKHGFF